jgi:hypothetical protein
VSPLAATKVAVRRIGILGGAPAPQPVVGPFGDPTSETVDELRQLGWVDGENLAIEYRPTSSGHPELEPELAAELVRHPVELIFAINDYDALAAMHQTSTIRLSSTASIRSWMVPARVQSLAHPGRNLTRHIDRWRNFHRQVGGVVQNCNTHTLSSGDRGRRD